LTLSLVVTRVMRKRALSGAASSSSNGTSPVGLRSHPYDLI
jgi:hypothetical protein